MSDVGTLTRSFLDFRVSGLIPLATLILFATPVIALEYLAVRRKFRQNRPAWPLWTRVGLYSITFTVILVCGSISSNDFIYFQF